MDFARLEREVDVVERDNARIALGEATRFNNRLGMIGHAAEAKGTSARMPTSESGSVS
jgi:hypothetical protein